MTIIKALHSSLKPDYAGARNAEPKRGASQERTGIQMSSGRSISDSESSSLRPLRTSPTERELILLFRAESAGCRRKTTPRARSQGPHRQVLDRLRSALAQTDTRWHNACWELEMRGQHAGPVGGKTFWRNFLLEALFLSNAVIFFLLVYHHFFVLFNFSCLVLNWEILC